MTAPPPERPGDPERPADRDRDEARDVDASFAAIISGWDGTPPPWPADGKAPQDDEPTPAEPATAHPPREPDPEPEMVEEDEGHYEPPEPPPVPKPHQATVGALAIIALGVLLLLSPGLVGFTTRVGFPLGLLGVTGGLAWLLLHLRPGPPPDSGWDDGAQL